MHRVKEVKLFVAVRHYFFLQGEPMKTKCLFLSAVFLLPSGFCLAEPFESPLKPVITTYESRYSMIGEEDGADNNSLMKLDRFARLSKINIKIISLDGKEYYRIREDQTLFNDQRVELTVLIETGEYLRSTSFSLLRKGPDGKEIERSVFQLDNPSWNYPDDIYCKSALPRLLTSFVGHQYEERSFHLWLSDQEVVRMTLKLEGEDQRKTPLGDRPHIKVKMMPDIQSVLPVGDFIAMLIQPFVPKIYLWYWQQLPHVSVNMEGAFGPGVPKMRMELFVGGAPKHRRTRRGGSPCPPWSLRPPGFRARPGQNG